MNNIHAEVDEILRTGNKKAIVSLFLSMQGNYIRATEAEAKLAEARAEIERKDKLIEQMRGALTKLIGTLEVMSVMPETLGKCPVLAIDAPELEQARAALAAERTEK